MSGAKDRQDRKDRRALRTRARRQALQMLYQCELSGEPVPDVLAQKTYSTVEVKPAKDAKSEETLVDDVPLEDYATTLALGVHEHLDDIDQMLAATSENWKVWRMPVVDRNILRIAAYEIAYGNREDVPIAVAINEAVELARAFAGEESTKFVNGVIGAVASRVREQEDSSLPTFDSSSLPSDQVIGGDVITSADQGADLAQAAKAADDAR